MNAGCHYARHGPDERPGRKRPPLPRRDFWVAIVQADDGQVLLQQRQTDSIWGGLWSLPEYPDRDAAQSWAKGCGGDLEWQEEEPLTHRLSHMELRLHPLRARVRSSDREGFRESGRWFDPEQLTVGVAAPIMKLIRQAPASGAPQ